MYQRRRDLLVEALQDRHRVAVPKGTIYVWARVPTARPPPSSPRSSRRQTSSCRPARPTAPSGEGFVRIALTMPDDRLAEAIQRISALVGKLSVAPELPVRRLHPEAAVPRRAHPATPGLDLVADRAARACPGGRVAVPTGIAVAIPGGHAGPGGAPLGPGPPPRGDRRQRPGPDRLGLPGRADRARWSTSGPTPHWIAAGDRVAQLVMTPVADADPREVDALPGSDGRGEGGFGSTGA